MSNFIIILITFILLTSFVEANDVKIIELHKSKSLDQLVLETNKNEDENQNNLFTIEDNSDENNSSQIEIDLVTKNENNNLDNSLEEKNSSNEIVTLLKTESIFDLEEDLISEHLDTIKNIQSKTLHREFIKILSNIELEDENIYGDKIYFIIKKLYEIGEIENAYKLIKKINFETMDNKMNLNFFYFIELNYLYSSYKLTEVCELKSFLLEQSTILPKNLLQKTDIFCLTLENKYSEAKLLNSVLLESEIETDQNFQNLFNYMILNEGVEKSFEPLSKINSNELIFLYSAMLRINELPLYEDFINVDPLNLSIPVILSESTEMETRIKAANKAYYDEVLSIDSLSALYQSVDFNSKQLNNSEQTIESLSSKELLMAYYYQLANIQIFPDERLDVVLKYWDFAKKSGLDKIAYAITEKILETFTPTVENAQSGMQIAFAYISNENYEDALKWITLYEMSNPNNDTVDYAKFLINLNQNNDLDTIIKYLSINYKTFDKINNQSARESLEVLIEFLNIENEAVQKLSYFNIIDDRTMPTYSLIQDIKFNINNNLSCFILALISMQNRNWIELHPEHLNLILDVINLYDNGSLKKQIILEILHELEIF